MFGKKKKKEKKGTVDNSNFVNGLLDKVSQKGGVSFEDGSADTIKLLEADPERRRDMIEVQVDNLMQKYTVEETQYMSRLERGYITRDEFLAIARTACEEQKVFSKELIDEIIDRFAKSLWAYDILDDLINDDDISDIKVLAYDVVRIKKLGKRHTSEVKFSSEKSYTRFVERVAVKNKVSISDKNALTNFTDKDSNPKFILRFDVSTPFVNSVKTPYLAIRKIPKVKKSTEQLIEEGLLTQKVAEYLMKAAQESDGIVFTGKGASGKTTLMNWALDYIPKDRSGLVIQENEELFTHVHNDLMFQHVVSPNGEGKITYDLKDLARNGLLADLDYFVIGEIKGEEALYFLNAAYTGHKCWASVHGASSTEAINKLVDYIKYASDYRREEALQMLTHLHTVVFLKDYKVSQIAEVIGYDEEKHDLKYNVVLDLEAGVMMK